MSSSTVQVTERGHMDTGKGPYLITTGENVVVGEVQTFNEIQRVLWLFFDWRLSCPQLSDSQVVADLIRRGLIEGPSPDTN